MAVDKAQKSCYPTLQQFLYFAKLQHLQNEIYDKQTACLTDYVCYFKIFEQIVIVCTIQQHRQNIHSIHYVATAGSVFWHFASEVHNSNLLMQAGQPLNP